MTDTHHAPLFEPLTLGAVELKNRVLMAPLTRNRAHPDGTPWEEAEKYYAQRAGAGLIFTEATQISPLGKGYINTPGIHEDKHVEAWSKITKAVHDAGGKIAIQLWHVGRISHTSLLPDGEQPLAPSALRANGQTFTEDGMTDVSEPRAMNLDDIKALIDQYRTAAENAKKAGFDAIEVHAANGYLLDQFLRDGSNKRNDAYGGVAENRVRLLKEVLDTVIEVYGADKVGVRLSPTGGFNDMSDSDPKGTFTTVVKALNEYSLAFLHVVEEFPGEDTNEEEQAVIRAVRDAWDGPYIANGGLDAEKAAKMVEDGKADAVTFGRPYIANPDLAERIRTGAKWNEPDHETFYGGDEKGYTDYPTLDEQKAA